MGTNTNRSIPIDCMAKASYDHSGVAMLVSHKGGTLKALLQRLDNAIAHVDGDGKIIERSPRYLTGCGCLEFVVFCSLLPVG